MVATTQEQRTRLSKKEGFLIVIVLISLRSILRKAIEVPALILLLLVFMVICASKQAATSKTRGPAAYCRGQGVGSNYNLQRSTGTYDGGTAPNQSRGRHGPSSKQGARHTGAGDGPKQPYGYRPGKLHPMNPRQFQRKIDEINRKYHYDMERIHRQHRDAIQNQHLAFDIYYQQQHQQRQQCWRQEQQRQWQHYQYPPHQESRRNSSRSSKFRSKPQCLYSILGVQRDATPDEIRKAYKKKVVRCHPDKGGSASTFRKVQVAYELLRDESKRWEYDQDVGNWGHSG